MGPLSRLVPLWLFAHFFPTWREGLGQIPNAGQGVPFLPHPKHIPQIREVVKGKGEHLPATHLGSQFSRWEEL